VDLQKKGVHRATQKLTHFFGEDFRVVVTDIFARDVDNVIRTDLGEGNSNEKLLNHVLLKPAQFASF
jgi:hypothetical protein